MNILIVNQPLNNRGDESAHKALVRNLSKNYPQSFINVLYPEAQEEVIKPFIVEANNVSYIKYSHNYKFYGLMKLGMKYPLFRLFWYIHPSIKELMSHYAKADLIVGAPGGISMGGFQNWSHLFLLYLAKMSNKPLAYYSRSFGPFPLVTQSNKIYQRRSYDILKYFCFLSIRDKKTEIIADEIGLNYISTVDTAFLDNIQYYVPDEIKVKLSSRYIVFVPNLLVWHYNYKNKTSKNEVKKFFINLISAVLTKYPDTQIVMLPQTYGYNDASMNDVNFFNEISDAMDNQRIIVLPDIYSSDIQQSIIKDSRFVIGARYHSIVFAINNDVPFISLSYEHKMVGLLQTLGAESRMIDITSTFDSCKNTNDTIKLFEEKLDIVEQKISLANKAKKIAEECFDTFCKRCVK